MSRPAPGTRQVPLEHRWNHSVTHDYLTSNLKMRMRAMYAGHMEGSEGFPLQRELHVGQSGQCTLAF
jgi:hypothetical protein